MPKYPKVAQLRTVAEFRQHIDALDVALPLDESILPGSDSPMAEPLQIGDRRVGNRWVIHPMEGWDANRDGSPSEQTLRRWHNFGLSGAKWIWGGEAAAVQEDGRANPNQTLAITSNENGLRQLLETAEKAHRDHIGETDDLFVGLQLTHSGRFCRPNSKHLEPRIAYHHPLLDEKFGIAADNAAVVWTDSDLERLIDAYVAAAHLAAKVGFEFVDVKACHGYLLHEFLSARSRPGPYGGDYEGRTRLLKTILGRIHDKLPSLMTVVRLSVFDTLPYKTSQEIGEPMEYAHLLPYEHGFGVAPSNPLEYDLSEPLQLIGELQKMGVVAVNVSCGSPYYNPHIQRQAIFPPSDGYRPPEDPLIGVARQIEATRQCKAAFPDLPIVGTGYSYLQDYLPNVAQAVVRQGWADAIGLGRMVLSYPDLPADTLQHGHLKRKKVCRTFSDCTTAPRNGLISGCFPLDPYYKELPANEELKRVKSK